MTSAVVPRRRAKAISIGEATRQFDLLFDAFFENAQPMQQHSPGVHSFGGEDVLESPGWETAGDVCADSASDTGQKESMKQLANELRKLGDEYSEKFGFVRADTALTTLFTKATELKYKTFQGTLESLMKHDRNITDFVFVMHVSKTVVSKVGRFAMRAQSFFRQYIAENYAPVLADAGGVREFMEP